MSNPEHRSEEEQRKDARIASLRADGAPDQRTANVLANCGYSSKAEVKEAMLQGLLRPKGAGSPRNYGFLSHFRVCEWVGLSYSQAVQVAIKT